MDFHRNYRFFRLFFFFACLLVAPLEAIEKPTGVFASAGSLEDDIYDHPSLNGVFIRVPWYILETHPGIFDFTNLDRQVEKVESEGKRWSLGILGGGLGSPDWLIDELDAPFIEYSFRRVSGYRLPLFWDDTVQARLAILAKALAGRYKHHEALSLVYVTQMTANGIEGHLQGVNMSDLVAKGYTDDRWVGAAKAASRSFAAAFMSKPIAFELHEINGGIEVPMRIINDLWNEPGLEQRVGAAMWWLSGSSDYQPGLIAALTLFPGDIYGQVIARSDQPERFGDNNYQTVFSQAKAIGIRYIEPWEFDFKTGADSANGAWDENLADFNAWSAANYPGASGITGQFGPPKVSVVGNNAVFRWLAIEGETYTVRRSSNLVLWEVVESKLATDSEWQTFEDISVVSSEDANTNFYRVTQD